MRIAIISNSAWYIYNFRLNKMKMLREKGYAINVLVPWDTKYSNLLLTEGFEVKSWKISRASVNPISEIYSILCLHKLIVLIKPNFIFTYTPKGNIYCNIVGLFSQLKIINNISGMGVISSKMKIFQFLVRVIYKLTLQRKNVVFFQNTNDMNYFIHHKLLKHNKYSLLPGSGVDTLKFVPNTKNKDVYLNFLFMGRLLIEKGLIDLIEAIKFIRFNYTFVQFFVLGMFEPPRSSAIIRSDIDHWVKDGLIRYLGQTDDVHSVLLTMDCLVFPSYYGEGIPRSLLEAASCGLPVITTNHPGCRDAVVDGVTGFLCEPKNPKDLSEKIIQFINMSQNDRYKMGLKGRRFMIKKFDESIVIKKYIDIIDS